ncbi:MAG TPA: histidine phosphatase family protein, partial [Mycobacterium sp.]|nr:histidine phosphatase family protein [Mycobacterium sp.]
GRFPDDEPLNGVGRRQVKAARGLHIDGGSRQLAGPEQRACQTAQLLGLHAATEPRLADLDCGQWRGQTLRAVGPADLETWVTDPARAPHGGESIVDLIDRVAGWLASLTENALPTVAVTHPAVVRAAILTALDIPPKSFWRIDIAPVSRTVMHFRKGYWTLRL